MTASDRWRDLGVAVAVQAGRFVLIAGAAAIAPLLGIHGWWIGLFVNVLCAVYAIVLVSAFRLWTTVGMVLWRGWLPAALLLVPLAEAISWALPAGLVDEAPGFGWWALTLLLVGVNEELISRGVVLERLRGSFPGLAAVALTALLFGLQHLSLLITTSRDPFDVLGNVAASACYGFGLAAFQFRFRWIVPLILIHALADFTTTLSPQPFGDVYVVVTSVVFVAWGLGILYLRRRPVDAATSAPPRATT